MPSRGEENSTASELTNSAPQGIQDHIAYKDSADLTEFGKQLADTAYGTLGDKLLLLSMSILGSEGRAKTP